MSYTTEDCKAFLLQHYPQTNEKGWKRTSKRKVDGEVQRTFIHTDIGEVIIAETNQGLVIRSAYISTMSLPAKKVKIKSTLEVTQKMFSKEQESIAEKIILQYVYGYIYDKQGKCKSKQEDEELIRNHQAVMEHPYLSQGFEALPSRFTFYFPVDCYGNEVGAVSKGINSPMSFNDSDGISNGFNIIFDDKGESDPDAGAHELLVEGILPPWVSFVDEYHLELTDDAPKITVFEFFKILVELGFEYKPGEMDCLFKKELKKITIHHGQTLSMQKINQAMTFGKMASFIRKNDKTSFIKALDDGFDMYRIVSSHGDSLFQLAIKENAPDFAQILLERGFDIWNKTGNYTSLFIHLSDDELFSILYSHSLMDIVFKQYEQKVAQAMPNDMLCFNRMLGFSLDCPQQVQDRVIKIHQHLPDDLRYATLLDNTECMIKFPLEFDAALQNIDITLLEQIIPEHYFEPKFMQKLYQLRPIKLSHLFIHGLPIIDFVNQERNRNKVLPNKSFDILYVKNGQYYSQNTKYEMDYQYYSWLLNKLLTIK